MKSKRFFSVLLFAATALCGVVSCKSEYEAILASNNADLKYQAAFQLFDKGSYQKAAQVFESLSMLTSGTDRDDTVQYYWGLCNYRQKDYFTAETNFQNFITNFPRSPFAESATFLRLDCLYKGTNRYELDQKPTYAAITAISEYMIENPDNPHMAVCNRMLEDLNERLDRKAFENAKLYYRMEDYKAARVALVNVLREDADNLYREDVLYYTAMSSYNYARMSVPAKRKERYMVFVDDYYNYIGEYPDTKRAKELEKIFDKVKDNETSTR